MNSDEATIAVIDALESLGVPYMLVGSFSTNFYGVPRATADADFVVQVERGTIPALMERLGSAFALDPQMTFEAITGTTRHRLRLVDNEFQIELFLLSDDPHDRERFARRQAVGFMGWYIVLPTVEDVIVTKLRWLAAAARAKDRSDLRGVIAVQGDRIDWAYVETWADRHDTRALLDEIRTSISRS